MNIDQQPELLLSTKEEINEARRRRVRFVDGERREEKLPQVAQGFPSSCRYLDYVRTNGATVGMVITSAAADLDPNGSYAQFMKRKARHFGWYRPEQCPVALLANRELIRSQIADKSLLDDRPCDPTSYDAEHPCRHSISEKAARTAAHTRTEAERMKDFQSEADKILGATRDQTTAIVEQMREDRELMRRVLEMLAADRVQSPQVVTFGEPIDETPRQRQQRAKHIADGKGEPEK